MCGRYSLTQPVEAVRHWFAFANSLNLEARYNIAPTQDAPIIALDEGERVLRMARWGLVPSWAKEIGTKPLINARAETATEKPAFRAAVRRRRCLVPADGFYEWQARAKGPKQPYRIVRADGGLLAMAGIWEIWTDLKSADELVSFAILTTNANKTLAPLHDRCPVILEAEARRAWLETPEAEFKSALACLKPPPETLLRYYPISTRVNRVANDDADLIEPAGGGAAAGQMSLL